MGMKNAVFSHAEDVPKEDAERRLQEHKASNKDPNTVYFIAGHNDPRKSTIRCYTKR